MDYQCTVSSEMFFPTERSRVGSGGLNWCISTLRQLHREYLKDLCLGWYKISLRESWRSNSRLCYCFLCKGFLRNYLCQKSAVSWQWIKPSVSGHLWCKRSSRAQFCVSAGWDGSILTSERCWGHESYLWDGCEGEMSKLGALAGGTRHRQGLIAGCAPGQTGGENPVLFYWIRIFRSMFYWITWQLHLSAKNWGAHN